MKIFLQKLAPGILMILVISAVLLLTDRTGREGASRSIKRPTSEKATFTTHPGGTPALPWRIHLLEYNESTIAEDCRRGIQEELQKQGLVPGRDYILQRMNAQGEIATLSMMIDSTLNDRPDVVLLTSTATLQNAIKRMETIPIVFGVVANPMLAGAGKSFSEHRSNVTGISTLSDFEGMAKVLATGMPGMKRIGTLFASNEDNAVYNKEMFEAELKKRGMELSAVAITTPAEAGEAIRALLGRGVDVVCQIVGNATDSAGGSIAQETARQRKPYLAFTSGQAVKGGAVVAVSRDYEQCGRDMVEMALRILNGENPAQIPIRLVSKTDIIVNRKNAAACGLVLPAALLQIADRVIE